MMVGKPRISQMFRFKRGHERIATTTAGNHLVEGVSRAVAQTQQATTQAAAHHAQMVEHNRGDHLYKWLKEAEQGKACPLMQAIRQAEEIRNRRLCIQIDDQLALTSRGFRFLADMTRSPIVFFFGPDPTVMKMTKRRVRKYIDPYVRHEKVEQDIQAVLELPDVNWHLLYMGVDEWPMHRKVLWGTLTVATLGAATFFSMAHYYTHEKDYAQGLTAVL